LGVDLKAGNRRAAAALYHQAEQCISAINLDLALISPNLLEIERVLSAFLLTLQIKSGVATNSHRQLPQEGPCQQRHEDGEDRRH
jgi:hypothetical protein